MIGLFGILPLALMLPLARIADPEAVDKMSDTLKARLELLILGALIGFGVWAVVRAPRGQRGVALSCLGSAMIVVGVLILAFLAFILLLLARGALP